MVDTVLSGGDFCRLESLRRHSPETSNLLERLQSLVAARADLGCETRDLVHFDFNPLNILVEGDAISGVIDWDGSCAGDRAFDLATLLFYSYDAPAVRDRLRQEAWARTGADAVTVYLCHLSLRQLDWSLRHHHERTVRYWIRQAQAILRELEHG